MCAPEKICHDDWVDYRNDLIMSRQKQVKFYAYRLARHSNISFEDAVQEITIRLIDAVDSSGRINPETAKGYFSTVLTSIQYKIERDMKRMKRAEPVKVEVEDHHSVWSDESDCMMVARAMDKSSALPDRERLIFQKIYLDDVKLSELADDLGIKPQALTPAHNNLKRALKEALLEAYA